MKACLFHPNAVRKFRGAFTLIELLITIVIIAVVATLAFPALQGVNDRSKIVQCTNNLRQMGAMLGVYAADHQGDWFYPDDNRAVATPGTWIGRSLKDGTYGEWLASGKLFPYIKDKRVWVCPANSKNIATLKTVSDYTSVLPPYPTDYVTRGFNQSYHPTSPQMRKLGNMERRAIVSCTFAYAASNPASYPLSWHNGIYPVLFSDGSVRTCQIPAGAIKTAVPPDINNNTGMQMRIWDYFDGKTTTLSL